MVVAAVHPPLLACDCTNYKASCWLILLSVVDVVGASVLSIVITHSCCCSLVEVGAGPLGIIAVLASVAVGRAPS